MKIFTGIVVCILCLISISPSMAQKDEDVKITIDWNNEEIDLEDFFESLGESIELAFSNLEDGEGNISIEFNDRDFEEAMEDFGKAMERFGEGIEKAVKNMKIEIRDVDIDDLKKNDSCINGNDMSDIIEEIEDEYNSDIKTVDRMLVKLNEDHLDLEFDLTFENGKEVRNLRKRLDNVN